MKCFICDKEAETGVGGPKNIFVCSACTQDLSDAEGIKIEGKCSFCGTEIGAVKGFFRSRTVLAVAVNPKDGTILCSECGKLCNDIIKYEVKA
jgi:hypothetical protein